MSASEPRRLFRVQATKVVKAKGGGLDLSTVPPGDVAEWVGGEWKPAELPADARHTKNVAGIGV